MEKEDAPLRASQKRTYGATTNEQPSGSSDGRTWEGWDDVARNPPAGVNRRNTTTTTTNNGEADKEKHTIRPIDKSGIFQRKQEGVELMNTKYTFQPDEDGFYFYVKDDSPTPEVIHVKELQASVFDEWCPFFRLGEWEFSLPYLILLGSLSGLVSAGIDYCIDYLQLGKNYLIGLTDIVFFRLCIWITFLLILVFIICFVTQKIAPTASGSGVPEIKTILSGTSLEQYVHWKNMVVKIIGMATVSGSGMILGKPLSHVGAVIASELLRLPFFKKIGSNGVMRQQMLAAGAACGVSGNFGSPLGGVLFSIEVTSTYYPIRNYLYAFVSCIFASIVYLSARKRQYFLETRFAVNDYNWIELFVFAVVGLFGGLFGVTFVRMNNFWVGQRRRLSRRWPIIKNPYFGVAIIGFVTSVITFPDLFGSFASFGMYKTMKMMLTLEELGEPWYTHWGIWYTLLVFFFSRLILGAVSTTLMIPGGAFVPLICMGCVMGRICGEWMKETFPDGVVEGSAITPGVYAAIGAAAMLCGATHSLASAVIVFELTGQLNLITPMLIAVVVSYYVSSQFGISIYDQALMNRGLPWLPDIRPSLKSYSKRVKDFMSDPFFLTKDATFAEVSEFVKNNFSDVIPIVDTAENMTLLGITTRANLNEFIHAHLHARKVIYEPPVVQLSPDMLLTSVHLIFIGLRIPMACVTENGRLVGVVDRKDLIIIVNDTD